MRRMADYHFAQAATSPDMHAVHARFFHDYNGQKHFAHRDRPPAEQSPAKVLRFVQGAWCDPADLDRLFRVRAHRWVDAGGSIRFRDWRLHGERGLAGAEIGAWSRAGAVLKKYPAPLSPSTAAANAPASCMLFPSTRQRASIDCGQSSRGGVCRR